MVSKAENKPLNKPVFFELGFRPFFFGAGIFSVIAMLAWMAVLVFSVPLILPGLAPGAWHAHEMVYGYAMAVVAGFLLTAVVNWTGVESLNGRALAVLFLLWLLARVAYFLPFESALLLSAGADSLFLLGLALGVSRPVMRVKQWKQMGLVSKLWLLIVTNGLFYAGALGYLEQGMTWGIYAGLYLILGLLFTLARRVIPFFIGRGVDEDFSPRNHQWIDVASPLLFSVWAILDIFTQQEMLVAWFSILQLCLHAWRMRGWYTPGLWSKPLLWSLYIGYGFLPLGFMLKAFSIWWSVAPDLALHAFVVGGVGLMTIGMMSRVSWGHTGRNIALPPRIVAPIFLLILLSALFRVVVPVLDSVHLWSTVLAQAAWILGFSLFVMVYFPVLTSPRVDQPPS